MTAFDRRWRDRAPGLADPGRDDAPGLRGGAGPAVVSRLGRRRDASTTRPRHTPVTRPVRLTTMTARETADPGVAPPPNGGPERRTLDVARFGGGVASDSQHAALRASVRQLGQLLGEALTRHEGAELLALVEQVRATAREPGRRGAAPAAGRRRRRHGGRAGPRLHRVLPARQRHRAAAPLPGADHRRGDAAGGHRPPDSARPSRTASVDRELVDEVLARVEYRPVFTAHPTEATRRTVLTLLRKIADVVDAGDDPRRPALKGTVAPSASAASPSWSTCSGRPTSCASCRPQPTDEARTSTYYLRSLATSVVPDLLEELDRQLATIDITLPLEARPLRFGTWAGGDRDGNPNVTPAVTLDVAPAAAPRRAPGAHRPGRGPAHRGVRVHPGRARSPTQLTASLEADAEALPDHVCGGPAASTPRSPTGSSSPSSGSGSSAPATGWRAGTAARAGPRLPRTSTSCSPTSP